MRFDREPIKDNEIICDFCGPGTIALWEVILTDEEEEIYICDKDHKALADAELIVFERRIGAVTWEDATELREFLDRQEHE